MACGSTDVADYNLMSQSVIKMLGDTTFLQWTQYAIGGEQTGLRHLTRCQVRAGHISVQVSIIAAMQLAGLIGRRILRVEPRHTS
jgi:hypothetical protein